MNEEEFSLESDDPIDLWDTPSPEMPYLLRARSVGALGGEENIDFSFGGTSQLPDGKSPNPEDYAALPESWFKKGIVKAGQPFRVFNPEAKTSAVVIARHAKNDDRTSMDLAPHTLLELGNPASGLLVDLRAVNNYPVARYPITRPKIQGSGTEEIMDQSVAAGNLSSLNMSGQSVAPEEGLSDLGMDTEMGGSPGNASEEQPSTIIKNQYGAYVKNPDGSVTSKKTNRTYYGDGHWTQPTGDGRTATWYPGMKSPSLAAPKKEEDIEKQALTREAVQVAVFRKDYPDTPEGQKLYEEAYRLKKTSSADAKDVADAIIRGEQAPDLTGLRGKGLEIRAELSRRGYDHATALNDWNALKRHTASLNSPQLVKLRSSAQTAFDSLGLIDDLAARWKANAGAPTLNRANMLLAKNNPIHTPDTDAMRSIAQQLEGQIANVTSEIAVVNQGGGVPTIPALTLASKELSADWDENVLHDMTNLARKNLEIRLNSYKTLGPAGQSTSKTESSPHSTPSPTATPAVNDVEAAARRIIAKDPNNEKAKEVLRRLGK